MRKVIIKRANSPRRDVAEGTQGVLLTWGIDAAEEGGSNTIAIIELEDGSLVEAYPTCIQFCEPIMRQLAATPANIARACGMENEVESAQEVTP